MSDSQFNSPKFKKLQAKWYQKLKKSGFDEKEDINSPNQWMRTHDAHWFRTRHGGDANTLLAKQEYFYQAGHMLTSYRFRYKYERKIWELWASGQSMNSISAKLRISYYKVDKVVKRIEGEMLKWK